VNLLEESTPKNAAVKPVMKMKFKDRRIKHEMEAALFLKVFKTNPS